jgi:hypothetical protein
MTGALEGRRLGGPLTPADQTALSCYQKILSIVRFPCAAPTDCALIAQILI